MRRRECISRGRIPPRSFCSSARSRARCASARPSRGSIAKWVTEIDDPARIPELIARAFCTATGGRPGPVVIALPEDMLVERVAVPDAPAFEAVEIWPGASDMSRLQKLLWAAERA